MFTLFFLNLGRGGGIRNPQPVGFWRPLFYQLELQPPYLLAEIIQRELASAMRFMQNYFRLLIFYALFSGNNGL